MSGNGKRDIGKPVRWLPSAWARIRQAAEVLTERNHVKTNPADVIRTGTLRYVEEVLASPMDMRHGTRVVNHRPMEHPSEAALAAAHGDLGIDPQDVFNDQPDPLDDRPFLPEDDT